MRRFVIIVDSDATRGERDAVTDYLRASPHGWWHWFPYSWLVVDLSSSKTARRIRDEIKDALGGSSFVVIQIEGDTTWAAFTTTQQKEWLYGTWSKD